MTKIFLEEDHVGRHLKTHILEVLNLLQVKLRRGKMLKVLAKLQRGGNDDETRNPAILAYVLLIFHRLFTLPQVLLLVISAPVLRSLKIRQKFYLVIRQNQ